MHCETRGDRTLVGYDETETLVYKPADLYVLVTKYPKYACAGHPDCGIGSPERPTSLVEGHRYDTSVAATIVEAKWFHYLPIYRHQDLFAGAGWMPNRSSDASTWGKVIMHTLAAGTSRPLTHGSNSVPAATHRALHWSADGRSISVVPSPERMSTILDPSAATPQRNSQLTELAPHRIDVTTGTAEKFADFIIGVH
jgi:transposase